MVAIAACIWEHGLRVKHCAVRIVLLSQVIFCCISCTQKRAPDPTRGVHVQFTLEYEFYSNNVKQLRVYSVIPPSIPRIQVINAREYSLTPNISVNSSGDSIGEFRYIMPPETLHVRMHVSAILYAQSRSKPLEPKDSLSLLNIQDSVSHSIRYVPQNHDLPLDTIVLNRQGDCSDFANFTASLCRNSGFEARIVSGIHWRQGVDPLHSWAECRRKGGEWVSLDATWNQELAYHHSDSLTQVGLEYIHRLLPVSWKLLMSQHDDPASGPRWMWYENDGGMVNYSVKVHIDQIDPAE